MQGRQSHLPGVCSEPPPPPTPPRNLSISAAPPLPEFPHHPLPRDHLRRPKLNFLGLLLSRCGRRALSSRPKPLLPGPSTLPGSTHPRTEAPAHRSPDPPPAPGPPIEEDVGLGVLHHRLMDLGDVLVVELIPLPVDDVLAVSDVVTTCGRRGGPSRAPYREGTGRGRGGQTHCPPCRGGR